MTTHAVPNEPSGKGPFKAWHALLCFAGFFSFMFLVNGIFLWTAVTTFPGEDIEKSYLAGLDYNHELGRRAHQAESGWRAEIGYEPAGNLIRVQLLNEDGAPLQASEVIAILRHPADTALDRVLTLHPSKPGEFQAQADGIHPGLWTLRLTAELDAAREGADFMAEKALLIP